MNNRQLNNNGQFLNSQQLIYILILVIIIAATVIISLLLIEKQKKKNKTENQVIRTKRVDFWFKLYSVSINFYPLRNYLLRIRKRIEMFDMSDNWTVSRKTIKFSCISLGVCFLLFLILMAMDLNVYFLTVSGITIYVIHNQIISIFIDRIENRLLIQFDKFLGDVRHHYHEHGMIDEAIYDAIEDCPYEMSVHANKMYEVLTSVNPESELEKYNDIAPNKYFKIFLSNCFILQRFGDKIVDDESVFLTNLNYLKQEINIELLRRQKLDYLFNSLSVIAVAPIFALKPLEKWGISNMPEMANYYYGSYGFTVQIILFFIVILAYQLINRLRRDYEYRESSEGILGMILKVKVIANFISIMINKQYNKALKYANLMRIAGIHHRIEHFYLQRIMYLLLGLITSTFIFTNIHAITRNNILYRAELKYVQTENIDEKAQEEILKTDRKFIRKYSGKKPSLKEIKDDLLGSGSIDDSEAARIAAQRIREKLIKYNNEYFKWWELIISLLIALACYNVPYGMLIFRKKIIQMNMEDEVMQFHTIILMLMHIERISVEDILKWMEQFAFVFKDSISKCIINFENGDTEALEQLKIDEPFVSFGRIVENLQSASDKIPIVRAFDQLKVERGYYQEKRKQDNEILINKKGTLGKLIAYIPLGATTFLYLLLPFILISVNQLMTYSEQMKNSF